MTPISITLTLQDMIIATRFASIKIFRKKLPKTISIILVISAAIPLISPVIREQILSNFIEHFFYLAAAYVFICSILVSIKLYITLPRATRRIFLQTPSLARKQQIWWNDETLYFKSEEGETQVSIVEFHKWAANDEVLLIYPNDYLHYIFPRQFFCSDAQFADLMNKLEHHGIRRI